MKTYEETLKSLRAEIPDEQYVRVMYQTYCEINPDFLGFIQPYEIVSEMLPKEWTVIDLGCNAAAQCFFFSEHAGYVGVDLLRNKEADPEDIMSGICDSTLRFESGNTTHYELDIKSFLTEHGDITEKPKTLALCVHVPDNEAAAFADEKLSNILIYDPEEPVRLKTTLDEKTAESIRKRLEELRKKTLYR